MIDKRVTVIEPTRPGFLAQMSEVWAARHLLGFFVRRDLALRYKQTMLGVAWVLMKPAATTAVFTAFFGGLAGIDTGSTPYTLFSLCGVLLWTYHSGAVGRASQSLVSQQHLVRKVYFPRMLALMTPVCTGLVDLAIGGAAFFVVLAVSGNMPGFRVVLILPALLVAMALAFGVGLWLGALNVRYRDVGHVTPYMLQLWMFLSPVIYPTSLVPPTRMLGGVRLPVKTLYMLNPMTGVLDTARWVVLDAGNAPWESLGISFVVTALLLAGGIAYFRLWEGEFADVV